MLFRRLQLIMVVALATLSLTACGGGGSSSSGSGSAGAPTTASTGGIAVDPYLTGAVFEEIGSDGRVLQRNSTESDKNGRFRFPKALSEGSTVRLKISKRGMHGSAPFNGMIKRIVPTGASGELVVSPLTTLAANGASDDRIIQLFRDVGLTITSDQIEDNPMEAIEGSNTLTDAQLTALQANMALNMAFEAADDFELDVDDLSSADKFGVLQEMADAVKTVLNETEFNSISDDIANDPALSEQLQVDDLLSAVIEESRTLVDSAKQNMDANSGHLDRAAFAGALQDALRKTAQLCKDFVQQRQNDNQNPGPGTSPDGAILFADNCAGCHNLGNGGTMDLSSKGAAAETKISGGHMGVTLTTEELTALSAHLDGQGGGTTPPPTPDPGPGPDPTPVDGQTVFTNNCSSCHNIGNGGIMDLSGKGTVVDTKINGGHMGIALSTEELTALVGYVDSQGGTTPPPTPDPGTPPDGTALYNSECAGCHGALANTDIQNRTAASIQGAIDNNFGNMGYLNTLTAEEVQAIADALPVLPDPGPGPAPDGQTLYDNNCASCHAMGDYDTAGNPELGGKGNLIPGKINGGHMGLTMTTAELDALAIFSDANPPTTTPPPTPAPDGQTLYDNNCASCHAMGEYDTTGNPELGSKGNLIPGKLQAGHMGFNMTAAEQDALAVFADANPPAPTPPPTPAPDGQTLYDNNCASCHAMGEYDTAGNPELGSKGNLIPGKINGGHMGISMTTAELDALAAFSDANPPAPTPPPTPAPDGQTLYDNNCASCHAMGEYDAAGSPELGAKGNLIPGKINGGHMGISMTTAELDALAIFADANPPVTPPPNPAPIGEDVYNNNCAGCHSVNGYDASGTPDLAAKGNLVSGKLAAGHMGQSLTADEESVLATFLDQYQAPATGPDYSDCLACHAQPPDGNSAPNTDGAHTVHAALPGIGTDCTVCHTGADHNGQVDLGFPASVDAKSGVATDNLDGTCSNISCHGGGTTPDWWTGNISVNSDCNSCHSRGTSQYNSQNSGEHNKHKNYSCTSCHNTGKMGNHFGNLATPGFETDPASTIGGGSTRVGNYDGRNCSNISCHGGERW